MVVDLHGVGQNLQDHPNVPGLAWTVTKGSSFNYLSLANPKHVLDYVKDRQGIVSCEDRSIIYLLSCVHTTGFSFFIPFAE